MDFVLGALIGISVCKSDGDRVGCLLGRIIGTVINTKIGKGKGFSLY